MCVRNGCLGVTTNTFLKNLGWAKKGIYSFTYVPLDILSTAAVILLSALPLF